MPIYLDLLVLFARKLSVLPACPTLAWPVCSSSLDSDQTLLLWETLVALGLNPSSSTYQLNDLTNVTNLFVPHFWLKIIVYICQSSCEFQVRQYLVNT